MSLKALATKLATLVREGMPVGFFYQILPFLLLRKEVICRLRVSVTILCVRVSVCGHIPWELQRSPQFGSPPRRSGKARPLLFRDPFAPGAPRTSLSPYPKSGSVGSKGTCKKSAFIFLEVSRQFFNTNNCLFKPSSSTTSGQSVTT